MKHAVWITHPQYTPRRYQNPWDDHGYALGRYNCKALPFAPYDGILTLLTSFSPKKAVVSAILTATALGIYDVFLNGRRVGNDEYKPGWTDYRCRVFADCYDVTALIGTENRLVAEVSPGWWSGRISYGFYGFPRCAFAAELVIRYADGSEETVVTGTDWKVSICGPVLRADIWDGEYYDARIPHASVDPDAHRWMNAAEFDGFDGEIVPRVGPPVRVKSALERIPQTAEVISGTEENGTPLGAVRVLKKHHGAGCEKGILSVGHSLLLDMGQNMVGRPCLCLRAARGTHIRVYVAEMRNDCGDPAKGNDGPAGSLYMSNYRSALSRICYVARGDAEECYFPTHSFFGFRYLELEADGEVEVLSVRGEVLGSKLTETGSFVCDNDEVNRLYSNIVWGMRGNYFSIPTDCPQRDERFGWTGDTQIFCGAAAYLADVREFLRKWLGDLRDSQVGCDGAYADVAPRMLASEQNLGNAAWADAGLIVPYRLWRMYGDRSVIAEHYDSMEAYMRYLARYGLEGAKDFYGDWLNYEPTDNRYMAMSYYAYDAALMAIFSRILEKHEREIYYQQLHAQILTEWRKRYLKNGEPIFQTQTACLLALAFDLLTPKEQQSTAALLKRLIEENDYTLSTGFVGTGLLCTVLSHVGLDELCYDLLLQTKDPSWLYSVRQGATTVWERWNSYTTADGFGKVEMNSFNHYAYGAVAEWFYAGMCGILPNEDPPGFSHFILRPSPDLRKALPNGQTHIGSACATYTSAYGTIKSGWSIKDDRVVYSLSVPQGTDAELKLLCPSDRLWINGKVYTAKALDARRDGERLCFSLRAGTYQIEVLL
ncbi:MAG: family 78 glycoside hydrolase catalytic domain [Clostridia bacterium]|nr:family 78 glycoside hydrolase catalytic domain [Clostridia bacterium]